MAGELEDKRRKYTTADKEAAIVEYVKTGSKKAGYTLAGCDRSTFDSWLASAEGAAIYDRAKKKVAGKRALQIGGITDKLLTEIQDRIERGNETVMKDGTTIYTKVPFKDLMFGLSQVADKAKAWSLMGEMGEEAALSELTHEKSREQLTQLRQLIQEKERRAIEAETRSLEHVPQDERGKAVVEVKPDPEDRSRWHEIEES